MGVKYVSGHYRCRERIRSSVANSRNRVAAQGCGEETWSRCGGGVDLPDWNSVLCFLFGVVGLIQRKHL